MDKKTVFIKTVKGEQEFSNLSGDLRRAMSLIDNKSTVDEMSRRAPPSLRDDLYEVLGELVAGEYIRDKNRPVSEAKIVAPKITAPKMFVPKPPSSSKSEELDFTSLASKPAFNPAMASRTMGKDDEAELAKAELEIAMAQSGIKPAVEDEASKEAKLRAKVAAAERARSELEAGIDAAKARASADAAAKAEAKARQEADIAARARAAAESKAMQEAANREQAEAKTRLEAAARMRAEQEAAREAAKAKAALEAAARSKAEADARVRAEIETAARARQVAEAKVKQEAETARLKAEQDAARVKAELEAAAKAKAEAEAARIRAEQEAARVKAELEAAKARAEAEAKALAEALAKQEAEEKARREAEERARREAEAARLKAEQEAQAARLKAEQEAAAKALLEAEAKAKAEALARKEAEAASREAEERIRKEVVAAAAAQEALARANAQKSAPKGASTSSFKIDLDSFLNEEQTPVQPVSRPVDRAEEEAKTRQKAEQSAVAEAKAEAEKSPKPNMAAEMARLKAEADAARQKAEEEERRRAEERALADEQAKAWAEAEQRAQAQAKIEAEQAAQQAALSQAKAANKSVPRKRREPLPLGKIAFGLIVLVLIAVVVLPYVYPLQEYIAPLEQRLSAQLKQPVRIGSMSAASIPPKLQLQNITVGIEQEIKIANVVLSIDPLTLFSDTKVISDAQLDDVSIKGNQLERLAPSLKLVGGDLQFPVRHLTLQRVKIVTDEVALPSLNGVAELDAQGAFTRIALHSEDEKYNVDLQPDQGRWQLGLSLKETSLPLLSDIVFSDLSAKGILSEGEVNFTEMDAHIFKGILLGSAKLNWRKGWQLQGRLEAKTFELDKMFPQYGIKGEMYGEGTFTLSGDRLSQFGGTRRLEASFSVKNGEIGAIDMVETARLLSRENLVGGRTRFDDLIGTVHVENGASDFRQLKIVSSMLSASGSFDVTPTGQLSGNLNAEIKMRAGNNQLTLFGTLAEPKLRAGR